MGKGGRSFSFQTGAARKRAAPSLTREKGKGKRTSREGKKEELDHEVFQGRDGLGEDALLPL